MIMTGLHVERCIQNGFLPALYKEGIAVLQHCRLNLQHWPVHGYQPIEIDGRLLFEMKTSLRRSDGRCITSSAGWKKLLVRPVQDFELMGENADVKQQMLATWPMHSKII